MNKCLCCDSDQLTLTPSTIAPFIAERIGRDRRCNSVTCTDCGAIFLDARYTDAEMAEIYKDYRSPEYVKRRGELEPDYPEMDKWFARQVPYMEELELLLTPFVTLPCTILDWGGDTGINAPFKGRRILHVYDIGSNPVIDGIRVSEPGGCYDLVVCANVLEHVADPLGTLQSLTKYMDAHSVLYLELPWEPLLAFPDAAMFIDEWHEHINFFMPKSISIMLDRCGLELLSVDQVIAQVSDFSIVQYLMVAKLYAAD